MQKLAAIVHHQIPLDEVSVEEYVQLVCLHMMSRQETNFTFTMMYGGAAYEFHNCIQKIIAPPAAGDVWDTYQ